MRLLVLVLFAFVFGDAADHLVSDRGLQQKAFLADHGLQVFPEDRALQAFPERSALCDFYESVPRAGQDLLINWCSASTPCSSWKGVRCSASGRVIKVDLANLALRSARLPQSIGNLSSLTYLSMQGVGLMGTIPSQLFTLKDLVTLNLGNNKGLNGSIPYKIGDLVRLNTLNLNNDGLSGPIPETVCRLRTSTNLFLTNNRFTCRPACLNDPPYSHLNLDDALYDRRSCQCSGSALDPASCAPIAHASDLVSPLNYLKPGELVPIFRFMPGSEQTQGYARSYTARLEQVPKAIIPQVPEGLRIVPWSSVLVKNGSIVPPPEVPTGSYLASVSVQSIPGTAQAAADALLAAKLPARVASIAMSDLVPLRLFMRGACFNDVDFTDPREANDMAYILYSGLLNVTIHSMADVVQYNADKTHGKDMKKIARVVMESAYATYIKAPTSALRLQASMVRFNITRLAPTKRGESGGGLMVELNSMVIQNMLRLASKGDITHLRGVKFVDDTQDTRRRLSFEAGASVDRLRSVAAARRALQRSGTRGGGRTSRSKARPKAKRPKKRSPKRPKKRSPKRPTKRSPKRPKKRSPKRPTKRSPTKGKAKGKGKSKGKGKGKGKSKGKGKGKGKQKRSPSPGSDGNNGPSGGSPSSSGSKPTEPTKSDDGSGPSGPSGPTGKAKGKGKSKGKGKGKGKSKGKSKGNGKQKRSPSPGSDGNNGPSGGSPSSSGSEPTEPTRSDDGSSPNRPSKGSNDGSSPNPNSNKSPSTPSSSNGGSSPYPSPAEGSPPTYSSAAPHGDTMYKAQAASQAGESTATGSGPHNKPVGGPPLGNMLGKTPPVAPDDYICRDCPRTRKLQRASKFRSCLASGGGTYESLGPADTTYLVIIARRILTRTKDGRAKRIKPENVTVPLPTITSSPTPGPTTAIKVERPTLLPYSSGSIGAILSARPTTAAPTKRPSARPTISLRPSLSPSPQPTARPTQAPSQLPTPAPTPIPTTVLLLPSGGTRENQQPTQQQGSSSSGQASTSQGLSTGDLVGLVVGLVLLVVGGLCFALAMFARRNKEAKAVTVVFRPTGSFSVGDVYGKGKGKRDAGFQPYLARQSANAAMMGSLELRTPSQRKASAVLRSPSPQIQRAMGSLLTPSTPSFPQTPVSSRQSQRRGTSQYSV